MYTFNYDITELVNFARNIVSTTGNSTQAVVATICNAIATCSNLKLKVSSDLLKVMVCYHSVVLLLANITLDSSTH